MEVRKYLSKPSILILSPINKGGGVALEVGYLASILKQNFQVKIVTVGCFYKDSEVYYFDNDIDYDSLDRLLMKNYFFIKYAASLLSLLKPIDEEKYNRLDNTWFKKYLTIDKKRIKLLKNLIKPYKYILLCNQLNGKYVEEVCRAASTQKIFMRITGKILTHHIKNNNINWLKKIHVFIHHSQNNFNLLQEAIPDSKFFLVDQSAYDEERFVTIPAPKKIRRFFTVSRLHDLKGIDMVIRTFKKINEKNIKLTIYGDGPQKKKIQDMADGDNRILIYGNISFKNVQKAYSENDCLIISSKTEAGPYTGVEAMAAGKPIISTRVGAMVERLGIDYPYFVELNEKSLKKQILKMIQLDIIKVNELSTFLRNKYISNHSEKKIMQAYHEIFLI